MIEIIDESSNDVKIIIYYLLSFSYRLVLHSPIWPTLPEYFISRPPSVPPPFTPFHPPIIVYYVLENNKWEFSFRCLHFLYPMLSRFTASVEFPLLMDSTEPYTKISDIVFLIVKGFKFSILPTINLLKLLNSSISLCSTELNSR